MPELPTEPQTVRSHTRIGRWLHWGTTALLFYGFVRNGEITDPLNNPEAMQTEVLFAIGLGALFVWRFVFMRLANGGSTRLPATAPRWERFASHTVHLGTYLGVAAIILTGLAIALTSSTGGFPLSVAFAAHDGSVFVTALLIVIHIAGALWHWLIRRDGVWQAMTGRYTQNTAAN
ncbi:MAG: cytochrome b [Rhizobiaceae bacterium]